LIVLACIAVLAVLILSFLPQSDKQMLHTEGRWHSSGHLLALGGIAYVAGRISRTGRGRFLLFLAALVLGFGIEVGEHLVFRSLVEWKDILVDAIGVVSGTLIAMIGMPKKQELS
jgi:hypothetical protein